MLGKNNALLVAGIVFAIVALLHLYRLIDSTVVFIGPYLLPMWVSLVGLMVAILLAIWMLIARNQD